MRGPMGGSRAIEKKLAAVQIFECENPKLLFFRT
jgi:hypothetical protein